MMSEVQFNRLLDAVHTAIAFDADVAFDVLEACPFRLSQPANDNEAANDNDIEWSAIPFPPGWNGAC